MKKYTLLFFYFFLFVHCFAWEKIELLDEFDDINGEVAIIQLDVKNNTVLRIEKDFEHNIDIGAILMLDNYIDSERSLVRIKVDKNKPVNLFGYVKVNSSGSVIVFGLPNNLLQEMKKGNLIKIILTYGEREILLKFNLNGFEENYKKLNKF